MAAALPHRNLNILLLDISRFQPLCSAPQAPHLKPDLRAQVNCGESDGGRRSSRSGGLDGTNPAKRGLSSAWKCPWSISALNMLPELRKASTRRKSHCHDAATFAGSGLSDTVIKYVDAAGVAKAKSQTVIEFRRECFPLAQGAALAGGVRIRTG